MKGYITSGTGRWDEFRACKEVLVDFTDGRILCVATPPLKDFDVATWLGETEKTSTNISSLCIILVLYF